MSDLPETSYQRRERLKALMWQAHERARAAEDKARATNNWKDWDAAVDAATALRRAGEAYETPEKGTTP